MYFTPMNPNSCPNYGTQMPVHMSDDLNEHAGAQYVVSFYVFLGLRHTTK